MCSKFHYGCLKIGCHLPPTINRECQQCDSEKPSLTFQIQKYDAGNHIKPCHEAIIPYLGQKTERLMFYLGSSFIDITLHLWLILNCSPCQPIPQRVWFNIKFRKVKTLWFKLVLAKIVQHPSCTLHEKHNRPPLSKIGIDGKLNSKYDTYLRSAHLPK